MFGPFLQFVKPEGENTEDNITEEGADSGAEGSQWVRDVDLQDVLNSRVTGETLSCQGRF